jgi:hypothetical protein
MKNLDEYITNIPIDDFTPYYEEVYESFSNKFYFNVYENSNKFENSELENKWLFKLFNKEIEPYKASNIIERAYKLYNVNKII